MVFLPPYPPYDPTDKDGFSYETVLKRWPIILTGIVDYLHNACHAFTLEVAKLSEAENSTTAQHLLQDKIAEGSAIIEKISKLKYEMARDRVMAPLPNDGEQSQSLYNEELERLENEQRNTWFTAPWLYAECYLYRLLRSYFSQTTHWRVVDPFNEQKMKTYGHSGDSILKIAELIHELGPVEARADVGEDDPETFKIKVVFNEMIQMSLWGNATDLSLLTHLSEADIKNLQTVGKDAQAARQKFILRDDREQVWAYVKTLKNARVDFILDNSGFELFTDLVFADFLVTHTPFVGKVVFHPKMIPWFVSDVTPPDFATTFDTLLNPDFFKPFHSHNHSTPTTPSAVEHLVEMATRWKTYLDNGTFELSVPLDAPLGSIEDGQVGGAEFWTTARPYWDMKNEAPKLFEKLEDSGLVIFKGDLNYRKLTGDIKWPSHTPFETALGPLAGSFPILSLRTNKADVAVGIEENVVKRMDSSGEKWRVDGRYALVSFLPRT